MKSVLVVTAIVVGFTGCASNRNSDAGAARIRDTTLTARDTTNPNDTLPRIRDSVTDSTP
jgi:predicted component of type VI protein secretion system